MTVFCRQTLSFLVTLGLLQTIVWAEFEEMVPAEAPTAPTSQTTSIETTPGLVKQDEDDAALTANTPPPSPMKKLEQELERRRQLLYPQKELNPPMQTLCKKHPKHKDLLSEEQRKFYCRIHVGFRACYTKDVIYNNDVNRQQKIKMAKDCIQSTDGMSQDFAENPDHLQDLTRLENFEKLFLDLMLPPEPPVAEQDPKPNFIEGSTVYEMGGRVRKDKTSYALNNKQEEIRKLDYVDKAFDQLNDEVLKYKNFPKPVYKQYVDGYAKEILMLDTIPEETNSQGQKIVYKYGRENCLSRLQSASDCKKLIEENKRQQKIQAIDFDSGFEERIIYRGRPSEQ